MNFKKTIGFNEDMSAKLAALKGFCDKQDGINHPFYACDEPDGGIDDMSYVFEDNDGRVLSALTVYFIDSHDCEIYGLTVPEQRENLLFDQLLNFFLADAAALDLKQIFLPVASEYETAKNLLFNAPGADFKYTEYLLSYEGPKKKEAYGLLESGFEIVTSDDLTGILDDDRGQILSFICDGLQVGGCYVSCTPKAATIYNYKIFESFRGRGLGKKFLKILINMLLEHSEKIILNVNGNNTNAYRMYTGCGFCVKSSIDYFSIDRRTASKEAAAHS